MWVSYWRYWLCLPPSEHTVELKGTVELCKRHFLKHSSFFSSLPLFLSRWWWWRCSHDQRLLRRRSHGHRVARRPSITYLSLPFSPSLFPPPLPFTPHHSLSVAWYDGVKRKQAETPPPSRIRRWESTTISRKHEEKWKSVKRERDIFQIYNALFLDAQ